MSVWLNRLTVLVYVAIVAVPVAVLFVVGNWPGAWIVAAVALVLAVLSVGSLRARAVLRRSWASVLAGVVASGAAPPEPPEGGWAEIPRPAPIGQLSHHDEPVSSVAFHPRGRIVASAEHEGTLRLWDIADPARPVLAGQAITTGCRDARTVRFSPDGHLLAVAGNGAVLWDVRDPAHPQLVATLAPPGRQRPLEKHAVAFHPNGTLPATASLDRTTLLWDTEHVPHLTPVAQLDHPRPVTALAFSPGGQTLATANGTTTTLWNTTTVKT